jgi:hypothetical protein
MRLPKDVVVKGLIDPRIRAFELHHSPKPPPTLSPLHNQMIARCK